MTNYTDTFTSDNLPAASLFPEFVFDDPRFQHPEEFNAATRLLDIQIEQGNGAKPCLHTFEKTWTYQELYDKSNQIAHVLKDDLGLVPGNRVLLRSMNNPMLVACWFGVIKAGGVVVTTMPLLRAKELKAICESAKVSHVLRDKRLAGEMEQVDSACLRHVLFFDGTESEELDLELKMRGKPTLFTNFKPRATDTAIIGFTSGTTGIPKMTAHFHRDLLNICESFPPFALQSSSKDVFAGSPPIGFTFGLGGLVLFPMYVGASSFLLEKPSPDDLLRGIEQFKVSICFTAPTAWKVIQTKVNDYNISSLRRCVSAGESLPQSVWESWYETTGLKIIDGIGATEMLHIFISSDSDHIKPGSTGKPIPGYEAKLVDEDGIEVEQGQPGRLAVRGITGCRYLNREEKQREYVLNGWNITGDVFRQDEDGYYWYVARNDDMIISSGYNIAAVDVENILLAHEEIQEVAVVGQPDDERGMVVCANIVLKEGFVGSEEKALEIKNWFKKAAAPYKYPRVIHFVDKIPKTQTGKIQRFKFKKDNTPTV